MYERQYNIMHYYYGLSASLLCFWRTTQSFYLSSNINRKRRVNYHFHHASYAFSASIERDRSEGTDSVQVKLLNHTAHNDYDLSSPRLWMEFLESRECVVGVYTVIRVDASYCRGCPMHTIWDKEFHLNRLRTSFQKSYNISLGPRVLENIHSQSNIIILELIRNIQLKIWTAEEASLDGVKILMLTMLWTPSLDINPISVKGHICSSNTLTQPISYDPTPIKAVIALPGTRGDESLPLFLRNLPNRFQNSPKVKMSSWCRARRPLEELFKESDVGEVLLVRECDDLSSWQVLEGLTSNIFILYSDGTLRTCHDGVLDGYAKFLVEKAAAHCNIVMSHIPITLQDAVDGLWLDVFITSAIRIITPVNEVVIPDYYDSDVHRAKPSLSLSTLWRFNHSQISLQKNRLWKELYAEILQSTFSHVQPETSL